MITQYRVHPRPWSLPLRENSTEDLGDSVPTTTVIAGAGMKNSNGKESHVRSSMFRTHAGVDRIPDGRI